MKEVEVVYNERIPIIQLSGPMYEVALLLDRLGLETAATRMRHDGVKYIDRFAREGRIVITDQHASGGELVEVSVYATKYNKRDLGESTVTANITSRPNDFEPSSSPIIARLINSLNTLEQRVEGKAA